MDQSQVSGKLGKCVVSSARAHVDGGHKLC